MRVLITMLLECVINEIVIYKQNPNKVIFITIQDDNTSAAIKRFKEKFPNIVFEVVYVKEFDVVGITKKINQLINREKGNTLFINVTEGRKTMSLAGVFAASINKGLTEGAFYLRQDTHELMSIPLPEFNLFSETKIKILKELENSTKDVSEINKKVKVHRSLIYASLKELISEGYIKKDRSITDSGRICLLAAENERER